MQKKVYPSVLSCQEAIIHDLVAKLPVFSEAPLLLLWSGGSSLSLLPHLAIQYLAEPEQLLSLTFGMVDDRLEESASNFGQFLSEYSEIAEVMAQKGAAFIDTQLHNHSPEVLATYFETRITETAHLVKAQGGKSIFLLGMGEDGHLAGIFPHPTEEKVFYERFLDTERRAVFYDATGKNQYTQRLTLTYPGLLLADELFVYCPGEKKRQVLETIENDHPPLHHYPALYLFQTPQPVTIFTTEE